MHTSSALNREKFVELLMDKHIPVDDVLDALEACVVPDPRLGRIEALCEQYSTGLDIDDWVPLAQLRAALR